MKQFKIDDQKKDIKNWILPENSLSQDELLAGIKQAEEGPFFTVQESMENFEQWLKSREEK
jgi:predicted transcriptional regulator